VSLVWLDTEIARLAPPGRLEVAREFHKSSPKPQPAEFIASRDGDNHVRPDLSVPIPKGEGIGTIDGPKTTVVATLPQSSSTPSRSYLSCRPDCPEKANFATANVRNNVLRASRYHVRAFLNRWTGNHRAIDSQNPR
jgi:hypothetical protein